MAGKHKKGKADDNYVHDEKTVQALSSGTRMSYVRIFQSLGRRFAALRRWLAPYRARFDERWVENAEVIRALPPPPARILDVGGATSPLPVMLGGLGYDVTVVDLRPYTLKHPKVRAYQGDVRTCAELSPPYDAVMSISVVEHAGLAKYGEEPSASQSGELVAKMMELVRPGGTVVLTVPFGEAHEPKVGEKSAETGKPTGFRVYDRAMLDELLKGHTVEERRTFGLRDGSWLPMEPADVEKIALRRYATGVAVVRLRR